jgi:error-prone DNA polymerase
VRSLGEAHGRAVERARREGGAFASVHDLRARSGVPVAALRALARADAMASLGLDRQHALWAIQALRDEERPLLDDAPVAATGAIALPPVAPAQRVGHDYHATGLSLKAHPLSFARERLERAGVIPAQRLKDPLACPHGASVRVAGMVLVRQRPATASGIVFMTIEDETGVANLILRPAVFERCRAAARHSVFVIAHGRVERSGAVVHVQVARVRRLDTQEDLPGVRSRDFH